MTTTETPPLRSLDELIAAYDSDPMGFRQTLSVHETTPGDGIIVGKTLSPIRLSSKGVPDDCYIWAGIARRLKQPGDVVVRIFRRSDGKYFSCRVQLGDADMWKHWREQPFNEPQPDSVAGTAQASMPQQPQPMMQQPFAPQQPVFHTGYTPGTDALGVVLQAMNNQQNMMMTMMQSLNAPRADPAVDVLKKEIERLQQQAEALHKKEDTKFSDYIDLVKKAETVGGGGLEAAAKLLAGPIDKVAGSISNGIDKKAEIELINAQARLAEAETKQIEAGVKAETAGLGAHLVAKEPAPAKTA